MDAVPDHALATVEGLEVDQARKQGVHALVESPPRA